MPTHNPHQNAVATNSAGGSFPSLEQQPSCSSSSSRPSAFLRPFRSLSSLQSSANTDEAFAAMEKTTLGPEPPPIDSPMMGQPPESDVVPETGPDCSQLSTDWNSIYACALLAFCSSVQFSLYFSSMWQYFLILDKKAEETFFGYVVAIYSLGQLIGSPIVGYISNRMRKIRYLLYTGLLIMFTGNALYLITHLFPIPSRKFVLLVARFITGVGSSNISLLKAYAASASTQHDRSRAIAFVTGGVALGMTMGPTFQLLFTPIGYPGLQYPGSRILRVNMYTAPAMLACAMNALNAICIHKLFREMYAGVMSVRLKAQNNGQTPPQFVLPSPDRKAMLLCYITRFTQMFIHTNLETLGSPLAMMMFAWTKDESVKYFSIAQGIMSFLAFLTYIAFILFRIDKIMNFRLNLMLSLFALIFFHALTYSYPFLPGHVKTYSANNGSKEQVGCDTSKFDWCDSVRPLSPIYFYLCYIFFIGLAFPNINVTLNTLFSQIIGPRRQGTQQGFLQMSGGTARMVGPVAISQLYSNFGPQISWMAEIAVTAITLALWFLLYRRMVPLEIPADLFGPETARKTSDGEESTAKRKSKRKRNPDERKPLVEPIEEENEEEGGQENGNGEGEEEEEEEKKDGNRLCLLERNNATVSTVLSLDE